MITTPLPENLNELTRKELEGLDQKLKEKVWTAPPNEDVPEEALNLQLKEELFMRGLPMPPGNLSKRTSEEFCRNFKRKTETFLICAGSDNSTPEIVSLAKG